MTENDLKRDILIVVNRLAPPTFANDISVPIESVIDSVLPIIRSYANALVKEAVEIRNDMLIAAAVEACVREHRISLDSEGEIVECYCGDKFLSLSDWYNHVRSAVTPESAAKELERIKNEEYHRGTDAAVCHPARCRDEMIWRKEIAEARMDELEICGNPSIPILDHYGRRKAYLEKRIAEFEAAKEK